jgi:tricarballylate dehydrogenase
VIGCGGAGLSAALAYADAAAQRGRPSGIGVLERSAKDQRGGATRWTTARLRVDDEGALAPRVPDVVGSSHRDADRAYVETLRDEAPATIRFLEDRGVELVHYPLGLATSITGGREAAPKGGGLSIVENLASHLERTPGAEILYRTEAVDLVLDEEGVVAGATARGPDGRLRRLPARAVVIACGGFEGSQHLLTQYVGERAGDMPLIAPGVGHNRGDGLRMAVAIGADTAGQFDMFHGEPVDSRTTHPDAVVLGYPYGIVVNGRAERFFDEGAYTFEDGFEVLAYEIWRNQGNRACFIGDQTTAGLPNMELMNATDLPPVTADTIGELGGKLGLDPDALEATVAAYNVAARPVDEFDPFTRDGCETHGLRPPKSNWAFRLESPPYLGYPLTCAVTFTFGGLRTDTHGRVLTPGGTVIPALYAAGEVTGVFYHRYPVGTSVLRSLTFGRLAGSHAAAAAD